MYDSDGVEIPPSAANEPIVDAFAVGRESWATPKRAIDMLQLARGQDNTAPTPGEIGRRAASRID